MRTTRKTLVALAAAAALAVTLTACGSDDGNSDNSSGKSSSTGADSGSDSGAKAEDHNAQDITFAQGMIPHHMGALAMAEAAAEKASSAEIKSLAARIEKAQAPEIKTMTGWLKTWGKDVPTSTESMPGMEGMAGMESMPGMDHAASGKEFDKNFLTMMIEHHKGAVTMATTEKTKGKYGPATAMADDVIRSQNAEITEMTGLLGKS